MPPSEPLNEGPEVAVDGGFGVLDPGDLALEGGATHPLGLVDIVADAALVPEAPAELEGAADRAIVRCLPLTLVGEPVRASRGEGQCARRQVELGDARSGPGADEAPAAEGLQRGRQLPSPFQAWPAPRAGDMTLRLDNAACRRGSPRERANRFGAVDMFGNIWEW